MLKSILIGLCIYSGIEVEYERSIIEQTVVGEVPVATPKKSRIYRFGSGMVTNPVPII